MSMTGRERKLHDLLTRAINLLNDSDAPSEEVSVISTAQEDLEIISTSLMNRKYVLATNEALALRLDAHRLEIEYILRAGILRRCNSDGMPTYRACDVASARLAIHEAREKGQPFGSDYREPAKATKKAEDEPEELESLDALAEPEEVEEGEVEALCDALED